MKVISIIALKGGVGKTTTTVSLATYLATSGNRVLVIDADPQCNTTAFFGGDPDKAGTEELLTSLLPEYSEIIQPANFSGVGLISASSGLIGLDAMQILDSGSVNVRALLDLRLTLSAKNAFDICLIDCPPGFTAASIAAILASDSLLVPVQLDRMSLDGWRTLEDQIDAVGVKLGHTPEMLALITMRDNSPLSREMEPGVRRRLPVCEQSIRRSPKVPEAMVMHQPLCVYSKTSAAARDYEALAGEVIDRFYLLHKEVQ